MSNVVASTSMTDRLGVTAVQKAFLEFGWAFREQQVQDFGVDAQVEIIKEGLPTGNLIGLQIKTGQSYFRSKGEDYIYYGQKRHLDYWVGHTLPVFLILCNLETNEILWKRIESSEVQQTDKGWSIVIPKKNVLNIDAKSVFEDSTRTVSEGELQRLLDTVKEVDQGKAELLTAIDGIAQFDKEMRIRILGYSLWFAPLQKTELIEYLARLHRPELVENNAQRLCESGFLIDTGNNYLPNLTDAASRLVCEQAMTYVSDEIIEYVGASQ